MGWGIVTRLKIDNACPGLLFVSPFLTLPIALVLHMFVVHYPILIPISRGRGGCKKFGEEGGSLEPLFQTALFRDHVTGTLMSHRGRFRGAGGGGGGCPNIYGSKCFPQCADHFTVCIMGYFS